MSWWRRTPNGPDPSDALEIIERNVALARLLTAAERSHLSELALTLIDTKRWEAVGGFDLTDEIRVTVAANACLPVLALNTSVYRSVGSIIVLPGSTTTSGMRDTAVSGVYNDDPLEVIGQAMPNGGPVSLAWDVALAHSRSATSHANVVIHEFAHKIDMADGYSDGIPPVARSEIEKWSRLIEDEFEDAASSKRHQVLNPYAWTNPSEFFAVASETFFCSPVPLHSYKPDLYGALREFYRQDPAARIERDRGTSSPRLD